MTVNLNHTPAILAEPSQMETYHDLVNRILTEGEDQFNERTGALCKVLIGTQVQLDLRKGFPALTARKVPFKSTLGEVLGFFRGVTSAKDFRELGCGFWDQNANETKSWLANPMRKGVDDLGPIYGKQWVNWEDVKLIQDTKENSDKIAHHYSLGYEYVGSYFGVGDVVNNKPSTTVLRRNINQLEEVVRKIMTDPSDRRILFTGWNVGELDMMALPPCHMTYTLTPMEASKTLHITMTMRSTDVFLGLPANIMSTSIILAVIARMTGYTPATVTIQMTNTHLYENSFDAARELLDRFEHESPKLVMSDRIQPLLSVDQIPGVFTRIEPSDVWLEGYEHGGVLSVPMMA